MTTGAAEKQNRFVGIDIARYVAFVAVVALHTWTVDAVTDRVTLLGIVDHIARFAVPYFFIASGYFAAGRDVGVWSAIWKVCRRLLPVYLFWVALYALFSGHPSDFFDGIVGSLRTLANGGAGYHLWFLPSLGLGLCAVLLSRRYLGYRGIAFCGVALYAIGLCLGAYRAVANLPGDQSRAGPLFAYGFVALGFWLRDHRLAVPAKVGWVLALAGLLLQLTEAMLLHATHYATFVPHNFLLGTIPFGLGVFLICLRAPDRIPVIGLSVASLGQISFGMYCIHVLFIWLFAKTGITEAFASFAFVTIAATLTIYLASFARMLRPLIR